MVVDIVDAREIARNVGSRIYWNGFQTAEILDTGDRNEPICLWWEGHTFEDIQRKRQYQEERIK